MLSGNSIQKPHQVLVVDDSPVYRKLIEHVLAGQPYQLLYAKDGKEALALYHAHSPVIVVSDWMMPDLSGLELCRKIRESKSRQYTYVILMTGNTDEANVVQGLAAGADDYLTKPFNHAEMLARIGVGRRIVELNLVVSEKTRELEEASKTDHLTGLYNRRALEEWGVKQLHGAMRNGFHFWIAACDIDRFKTINDSYGHEAGDSVLKSFAELMKSVVRNSDMCGRLGGDEFLWVVTHVNRESIELAVNRLRERFCSLQFPFKGEHIKVTASFGVAGFQGKEPQDFRSLLRQADQMLYEAKRAGRNSTKILYLNDPVPVA